MKKKLHEFFQFWNSCKLNRKLIILRTFFNFPACVYHELCHIIMMVLFLKKFNFKCNYFYEVKKTADYDALETYEFQASYNTKNNFIIFMVSFAPIFGVIGSFFISPYLFLYLLLSRHTSLLSQRDFNNIKEIIKPDHKKLSYVLNKSKFIFVHN